jgi:hypothetical protein
MEVFSSIGASSDQDVGEIWPVDPFWTAVDICYRLLHEVEIPTCPEPLSPEMI